MPKDLKGGKQTELDGHDDIVELKNREEALIAAEARFTELNGRIEVGLVNRMFALMEQLVKPMQSVKQEPKIGSTPILDLSPNRPENQTYAVLLNKQETTATTALTRQRNSWTSERKIRQRIDNSYR